MPQSVDEILANAKKVSQQAEKKFPSTKAAAAIGANNPPAPKPSYAQVPPARKAAAGIGEELKAKGEMMKGVIAPK
jgi:hypothetical protein